MAEDQFSIEFEERADQLSLDDIEHMLADCQIFKSARKKLLAKGAKLLVGPRGTGKTHLMRYTYMQAVKDPSEPIAFYANFNRYLSLEPLLKTVPDALQRFHSWVIAKLLLSCFTTLSDSGRNDSVLHKLGESFDKEKLQNLVSLLERDSGETLYEEFGRNLLIDDVIRAVNSIKIHLKRERAIFLLDDAALSLSDQYLIEFFKIFRLLKTEDISPKAAVYPGSTQYGPTFHASHEASQIELWLSVEDSQYSALMEEIAKRRFGENLDQQIKPEIAEALKYISFGIPRAYLRLLREHIQSSETSAQKKLNTIIEQHAQLITDEYNSLSIKLKQFKKIIHIGKEFFDRSIHQLRSNKNDEQTLTRNITIGLKQGKERTSLSDRMLRFLVEVGMLYPLTPVSHGANRKYDRYIPHFAFLYIEGIFRKGRGSSPRDIVDYLSLPTTKHPARISLTNMFSKAELEEIELDLPPCSNCGSDRINDSQRYCHHCGHELIEASLFTECMKLPLEGIPGISSAILARVHQDTKIKTIGNVYASQNASSDLQEAHYIGPVRAKEILSKVTIRVQEFLS